MSSYWAEFELHLDESSSDSRALPAFSRVFLWLPLLNAHYSASASGSRVTATNCFGLIQVFAA